MNDQQTSSQSFLNHFLAVYFKNGAGSMSKSDIDALVIYLIDKYGETEEGQRYESISNQTLSETLRLPLSKIKRLRYEGQLKFSENPTAEGRRKFLIALGKSKPDIDENSDQISFLVEDVLAKNWIQNEMKRGGVIYDGSFNSEMVKIKPAKFLDLLKQLFPGERIIEDFETTYNEVAQSKALGERKGILKDWIGGCLGDFIKDKVHQNVSSFVVNIPVILNSMVGAVG